MARQFGKYQLLKKIAAGGMAEIHLAKQRGMEGFEKIVVVKMILPHLISNDEFVQMFLDEARLAAKLTHPNIVQIFDLGRAAGTYFIAMEYIQGENLRAISKACRKRRQRLPLEHTVKIISQSCEGLYHAHTKTDPMGNPLSVVHRDISPQNILVSFEGMTKVVDFGIAKAATQYQETRSGVLKGKYAYMSPEQCTGRPVDARSDIFALGIVLWELATGTRLYKKSSELMILKEITEGEVPPPRQVNQQIPAELEAIILKALAKNVDHRFPDALHMHLALEEFLKNQGLTSSSVHLAAFMRDLFKDKLDSLRKIEQAQASGESLESFLFDDVDVGSGYDTGTGTGAQTPSQPSQPSGVSPVVTPSQPLYPRPTTGVSRVTGLNQPTALATQASGQFGTPTPAPAKRNTKLLAIIAILVILLGGMGYLVLTQLNGSGTDPIKPDQPDAGPVIAKADRGMIIVNSTPSAGQVNVDGAAKCETPCEVKDLALNQPYTLEVSKPGYRTWSTQFKLEDPKDPRSFSARLEAVEGEGWGWVEAVTDPPGASVSLDGTSVPGKTPLTINQVQANKEHTLRASLSGRRDWVKTFQLRPNQRIKLEGRLSRIGVAKKPAVYTLRSKPSGATFYLDGSPVRGNSVNLDPGQKYELTAKLNNFQDWSETVNPSSGERKRITARLRSKGGSVSPPSDSKGKLNIDATPWANIYVDGEKVGTTPLTNYVIAAGSHNIRLVNPESNATKSFSIKVGPGEVVRKNVSMAVETGKLLVRVKPWADVYVNGKKIGTAPIPPKDLPAGTYNVRLVYPPLGTEFAKSVKITAGETAKVVHDFLN